MISKIRKYLQYLLEGLKRYSDNFSIINIFVFDLWGNKYVYR